MTTKVTLTSDKKPVIRRWEEPDSLHSVKITNLGYETSDGYTFSQSNFEGETYEIDLTNPTAKEPKVIKDWLAEFD